MSLRRKSTASCFPSAGKQRRQRDYSFKAERAGEGGVGWGLAEGGGSQHYSITAQVESRVRPLRIKVHPRCEKAPPFVWAADAPAGRINTRRSAPPLIDHIASSKGKIFAFLGGAMNLEAAYAAWARRVAAERARGS